MKRIQKAILSLLYVTAFLLVAGLVILFFLKDSGVTLKDILFWVGAVPIAFFSVGAFGGFGSKEHSSYQLSRSVSGQSANQRSVQDEIDKKAGFRLGRTWIAAGLLVWLISYFL